MSIDDLREMQKWPLEQKVFHTITTVQSFMNKVDSMRNRKTNDIGLQSKGFYVSFSGGKDSTVLLDIVRRFIDKEFPACFCNTGVEYPDIVKFVKTFNNIEIIHPKTSFKRILETKGFPLISKEVSERIDIVKNHDGYGNLDKLLGNSKYNIPQKYRFLINCKFNCSNKCCWYLKKLPFQVYEKLYHRYPILGITCQESNLRLQNWVKEGGCNFYSNKRPISKPMSIWTEKDIYEYIDKVKLKICDIYDKLPEGSKRTGCIVCGFDLRTLNQRLDIVKNRYPKLYSFYMGIKNNGISYGESLNMIRYMNI